MRFDDLIVWHPYPAEPPQKSGKYITTNAFEILGEEHRSVVYDVYYSAKNRLFNSFDDIPPNENDTEYTKDVRAWAEMPQATPYEG